LPEFTPPPPLEARRDNPGSDGRVGVQFTSELIVPPNLADLVNKQEKRRRLAKARRLQGEVEDDKVYSSMDDVFKD